MKRVVVFILSSAALFCLFSCNKESTVHPLTGMPVVFAPVQEGSWSVEETKVNVDNWGNDNSPKILKWADGDKVDLYLQSEETLPQQAQYTYSSSSQSWSSSAPLTWGGVVIHDFFGLYSHESGKMALVSTDDSVMPRTGLVEAEIPVTPVPGNWGYLAGAKSQFLVGPTVNVPLNMFSSVLRIGVFNKSRGNYGNLSYFKRIEIKKLTIEADKPLTGKYRGTIQSGRSNPVFLMDAGDPACLSVENPEYSIEWVPDPADNLTRRAVIDYYPQNSVDSNCPSGKCYNWIRDTYEDAWSGVYFTYSVLPQEYEYIKITLDLEVISQNGAGVTKTSIESREYDYRGIGYTPFSPLQLHRLHFVLY